MVHLWGPWRRLPYDFTNDYEIVMEGVKQDGHVLLYASDELKNNRNIAMEAVKQNGGALQFVSKELRNDYNIVMEASKNIVKNIALSNKEIDVFECYMYEPISVYSQN